MSGFVTIALGLIGFATLWLKIKYGTEQAAEKATMAADSATEAARKATLVEEKLDQNTVISTQAKDAAQKAERQTNGVMTGYDSHITRLVETTVEHHNRIVALEAHIVLLQGSVDAVVKTVDSTRHELRGTLQTITNKLDLLAFNRPLVPPSTESK